MKLLDEVQNKGYGGKTMQKLELTWIGKGNEPAVEPRILLHDASKDYGDPNAENMLIHGDNLLALKALEQEYAGQVKCIYIDPPYNTGNAFEHYDDNLEHSIWLNLMKPRLEILRNLLNESGSIWITIDDEERDYLKVLCDEVFGRNCFIGSIAWRHSDNSNNNALTFSEDHNHILVYGKRANWRPKFLNDPSKRTHFKNPDNDPRGPWFDGNPVNNPGLRVNLQYDITTPSGKIIKHPPNGWRWSWETMQEKMSTGEIRFSDDETRIIRRTYLEEMGGLPPSTLWTDLEVTGHTRKAKYELKNLFPEIPVTSLFSTPKPELVVNYVLQLATEPGDLVLDSFLGSGTTAAVAHKMGRRYIGIELGEHCYTHCIPRLQAVVDGEQGGISKAQNWKGGGGFKFYELAPTLIVKDKHGQPIISEKFNPQMLVAAVAKLNGYSYSPNDEVFWKQGKSQENSYIFVTTEYLTFAMLDEIAKDLPEHERLLICSPAFDVGLGNRYDNIGVRKIPQSVLAKCEYGVDNYNLNIISPPELDEDDWEDIDNA